MNTTGTQDDQRERASWREWGRSHRLLLSWAGHLVLFAAAWFLAFFVRYEYREFQRWFTVFFLPLLVPVVVIKLIIFGWMDLYRGLWRYVGLRDFWKLARAAWLSSISVLVLYYGTGWALVLASRWGLGGPDLALFRPAFPNSAFGFDFAATVALVCGVRIVVREYYEVRGATRTESAPKLLIVGAGNAGENVVREILRMPVQQHRMVGFLDDDPAKHGMQIHGLEVLGEVSEIKAICDERGVDEILIAMPSSSRAEIRRVVELCQGTNLRFLTLPAMADLISGKAQVQQFRDVDIHDLLGRAPVTLDTSEIGKFLLDRVVMVTGAGGSIGSEMCRQIVLFKPKRLVLVEQAEQNLFEIERELRQSFAEMDIAPYIGDIGDRGRVETIFAAERPAAVVHAAAHKHVPMMESNPGEALKNNIHGTRVVADAATRHGCEKFVMISSDKAVNPTSIMGCTKRVAEMYIQGLNERTATQFVTVRFGNVLGSSGSVIPIFKQQIAAGGPVTVTHPDMVRYFMTIPEASQLVLQAASMGQGGEIFVLDMGEPVKIVDLARDLITLSGFRPNEDIDITFVGIRPGEKLYEELAIAGEDVAHTTHPKIGIWQNRTVAWEPLLEAIEALLADADGLSREESRRRLKQVVPEFQLDQTPAAVEPRTDADGPQVAARIAPA